MCAWGTSDGSISKSTNNSVTVAEKLNGTGDITDMRSHGGKAEVQTEVYVDAGSFANEAVNGQAGTSGIVSSHNLIESNTDFARAQKTAVSALTAATTTTTTTT